MLTPAKCASRMLVQEELTTSHLSAIERANKVEVKTSFLKSALDFGLIHFLVIHAVVPYAEGGAWRCTDHPIMISISNHLTSKLAVREFGKVLRMTVRLERPEIERAQSFNIKVAARHQAVVKDGGAIDFDER